MTQDSPQPSPRQILRARAAQNPPLRKAVPADARAVAHSMGAPVYEQGKASTLWLILRMLWQADGFMPLVFWRISTSLRARGVPFVPMIFRRLAIMTGQVYIGAPVILEPGIVLPHGQVVIDGLVQIGSGAIIRPFVTIGLVEGNYVGPTLERRVVVGTGAKILGPVTVGQGGKIGANAVVLQDVPAEATAVGVPARTSAKDG